MTNIHFQKTVLLTIKILTIILFVLAVARNFLNDNFVWIINGGTYGDVYYQNVDIAQSLLRWGLTLSIIVLPCAAFFKTRVLRNIAIYFCVPIAILCFVFYGRFLWYFTTPSGRAIMTAPWIRHVEFCLELIIIIVVGLLFRFGVKHKFDIKNTREWVNFFCLTPLALLIVIPVYLPQSLFGFTNKYMAPLTIYNILWILVIFLLLAILYFVYRFKDKETRRMICTFLALFLFYHYNAIYLMDLKMSRLPFQLCNLGAYLIIVALLINKPKFFNFVLLANVPGTMIAFCVPDVSQGLLSFWNIHFYIEHTWVFVIPLLIVALRVIERPKRNSLASFFIGFSIYFVFCAIVGVIANAYLYSETSTFFDKVNYFYLFNNTVIQVLSFLRYTRGFQITLNGYTFYPLYMLAIYVLYSAFCVAFYFLYNYFLKMGDSHFEYRQMRIELREKRGRYRNREVPKKYYDD